MNILFLGTAAADCKVISNNEPYHRYFSSALIDDSILIDPGPDVFDAADKYGVDLRAVKYVFNTHNHSDHFSKETIERLTKDTAVFHDIHPGEKLLLPGYEISAFSANHGTVQPKHFLIDNGRSKIYYALDGAWLMHDEVQAIMQGVDLLVLDGTVGFDSGDYRIFEHNDMNMVIEMSHTLKKYVKQIIISHVAVTLHPSHQETSEKLSKYDIKTAYDGLHLICETEKSQA